MNDKIQELMKTNSELTAEIERHKEPTKSSKRLNSMDITERIKTESELQKFRLVLDLVTGAVFILDKERHFEYVNPYLTRFSCSGDCSAISNGIFYSSTNNCRGGVLIIIFTLMAQGAEILYRLTAKSFEKWVLKFTIRNLKL